MNAPNMTLKLYTEEALALCQLKTTPRKQYLVRLASKRLYQLHQKSVANNVYALVALHDAYNRIQATMEQFALWQQRLDQRIARRIGKLPKIGLPLQSRLQLPLYTPLQHALYNLCKSYDTYIANLHRARLAGSFAHQNAYYVAKDKARKAVMRLLSHIMYLKKDAEAVSLNDYLDNTDVYRRTQPHYPPLLADNVYLALLSPATPFYKEALLDEYKRKLQRCQQREQNNTKPQKEDIVA